MKATYSKVNEISQIRVLLYIFRVYGLIQDQIGFCEVHLLRSFFTLLKQFICPSNLVSFLLWLSNTFLCSCFWGFKETSKATKATFHAGMSCFSLLLLWHSILQTLSSCFDIRFSSWLRLFSKFWIDSGFSQSLLLIYCCSYHGTDLNQWYLLVEGWEMCNTISWNSYWLTWITNFHVKWCIRTQHYGHNRHNECDKHARLDLAWYTSKLII